MSEAGPVPIVVLGEPHLVECYALGGARVVPAERPEDVRRAWQELPAEAVLVLTPSAAAAVEEIERDDPAPRRLRVVMPR